MSIHKLSDGVFEVRWREGGRNKSQTVHGGFELAKKIVRKKMSSRDENRHLDVKRGQLPDDGADRSLPDALWQ
jgi:hypothetical protein